MLHIKDAVRLEKIIAVFFEEGLGYYVNKANLHSHLPFHKRIRPVRPLSDSQRQAVRLRKAFERLGPTFMKLGQLLSLRPDLVPLEYCKEFEKLQDQAPCFSFRQVKKIIEEDLKKPLHKVFPTFEKTPLACASIAQVHRATLASGKKVAVKVQRDGIKKVIDADLELLFHIAQSLEKHFPKFRNYQPVEVVKEFALWTRRELNFEIEARNAIRLKEELKDNVDVFVPKVYTEFSSKRVLTLEFVEGVKLGDLKVLKKHHVNVKKVAMLYFTCLLEQALIRGLFHADPHPANIFVQGKGKLVYLDCGIMGELTPGDRKKVIRFIESIPLADPEKSLNIIISLARDTSEADMDSFKQEAREVLEEIYFHSIKEKSFAYGLYQIIGLGARHGVIFDANHVLIAKAFYQAEGLGLKIDPEFKVAEGLKVFSDKYLSENYSPRKIIGNVKKALWSNKELLTDLPEHLAKIVENLENPKPREGIGNKQLKELETELEYISKKQNTGIIIAALIIACVFLFYIEGRMFLFGIPLSFIFTTLTIIIVLYLFLTKKKNVWRSKNEKND